jgi:GTP-binding protein Era
VALNKKNKPFRSGYVSIIGRPNVGKSTLLNSILGEKISIVTSKPQTTRNRIIGIKTLKDAQIIFIDTPGIHRPKDSFGKLMVNEAKASIKDVDIIFFMVEPNRPSGGERAITGLLGRVKKPVFLLINKIDRIKKPALLPIIEEYASIFSFEKIIPVSALKGEGIDTVLDEAVGYLPEGPKYYPDDLVTEQLERFMVSEIIREKVMEATEEEVPHASAVEIASWTEKKGGTIIIGANIFIERDGQKGIIIGKGGRRLRDIGTASRLDIERLLNAGVFLELWVKVKKNWRSDSAALKELGFK